jgi:hypothetical protein
MEHWDQPKQDVDPDAWKAFDRGSEAGRLLFNLYGGKKYAVCVASSVFTSSEERK